MGVTAEERQQIYRWLNDKLRLPVYADAYLGATRLLEQRSPGYVTFVSHAARDLMNRLARTVVGIDSFQVQYVQDLDKLKQVWKDEWRGLGLVSSKQQGDGHTIPYRVCGMIASLISDHNKGRRISEGGDDLFFDTFLGFADKDKLPSLSRWRAARKYFQRIAHLREPAFSDDVSKTV